MATKKNSAAAKKSPPNINQPEPELVPLESLTPHPDNYRSHTPDQLEHIKESIRKNGVYRNVVVSKDSVILAGHGVCLAAIDLGMKEIKVIRLPWKATDPRSLKVLTGDNEISRLAGIDDRQLTNVLKKIKEARGFDLKGTGFDEKMLAALVMVTRPQEEIESFDAAAEWVGMPEHHPGEKAWRLWIQFRSEDDRARFLKHAKIKDDDLSAHTANGMTWSMWWPPKDEQDLKSLKFEETGDAEAEAS